MKQLAARTAALGTVALSWALVAAGALVSEAAAAPGFTRPVVISRHAGCVSLAGGLIDWTEFRGPKRHPEAALISHLARLSPGGPLDETTFNSGAGLPECSTLVASESTGAEVLALSQRASASFTPVSNEPLWLARPGGVVGPLGLSGLEPTVAMAPDGSGILAWLEYVGQRRRLELGPEDKPIERGPEEGPKSGPSFTVQAARISPTGQLGAPQTIGGPSAGYGLDDASNPPPGPPVAQADPDGTVTVAWELLAPMSESAIVQVSQAAPGQPFGAPQTLLGEAAARLTVPEDRLELAGNGGGGHIVQWQVGGEHTIESALQNSPAQPFVGVPALPLLRGEPAPLLETLMDQAGETMSLLRVPSGVSEAPRGVLAVARRRPDGTGQALEYLVSPQAHERVEDAQLAVRPDGLAAVVWIAVLVGRDGGTTSRVMLATAPPGGPFGPPAAVTGLASVAGGSAVAFDSAGALHLAWTADAHELSSRVLTVSAQPGSADPLSMRGPRVILHASHTQQATHGLFVAVSVDRPCLVRLSAVASARVVERDASLTFGTDASPLGSRSQASHYFTAAGTARLHILEVPANYIRGKPPAVRLLAYASSPSEASSVARLRLLVRRGPRFG